MKAVMVLRGRPLVLDKTLKVWGIDLGTTNSTVTEIRFSSNWDVGAAPDMTVLELDQPTQEGVFTSPLVPSVLAVLPSGGHWVGEGAKRLRARPQEAGLIPERTLFFETKNEMGLKKSYYRAAEPYDRPSKIAGHILQALCERAKEASGGPADRVVVTVPASFQLSQRMDTLSAARMAGLDLGPYDLLDEPTAALLAFIETAGAGELFTAGGLNRVLVFDFGGGTCDVSIVEVTLSAREKRLEAAMRAASRYHRLGGGDLDGAIVHDVLLPALIEENGIDPRELSWAEKKRGLEPQLLGTAEALKIGLCREIDRLKKFGKYPKGGIGIEAHQPPVTCWLGGRALSLSKPILTAPEWEQILQPFLDTDNLYARETEYRLTQSVFSPLQDALDRANLKAGEIDVVLLVGGSTLIPEVSEAMGAFFSKAKVVGFDDPLEVQLAVSKGAALHAFCLEVLGHPVIQPVLADTVALLTGKGDPLTLIQAGSSVPYPPDGGFARIDRLSVPASGEHEMRMEVVALPSRQVLLNEVWHMDGAAKRGEHITLEYRFGANGELECGAYVTERPQQNFHRSAENPLVTVVNPHPTRLRIESLEEEIRQRGGPSPKNAGKLLQLAKLYADLGQYEKAIDFLRVTLRLINRPDAELLNLMGLYYADLKDIERSEKALLAADEASSNWGGPLFNLGVQKWKRGDYTGAVEALQGSLRKEPASAPAQTLLSLCQDALGKEAEAAATRRAARDNFGPPRQMDDWKLGWFETWAHASSDAEGLKAVENERTRRNSKGTPTSEQVLRPEVRPSIEKMR
ncbi:MAG: Hsp70 family protein [Acidobacteriota bacterium]